MREREREAFNFDSFRLHILRLDFVNAEWTILLRGSYNAGQKLWQKSGNPAGLNTIRNILLPSTIIHYLCPLPKCQCWNRSIFTDKHFKDNIEIGGGGSSEMSPFLLKNTQHDVFAKLFCPFIILPRSFAALTLRSCNVLSQRPQVGFLCLKKDSAFNLTCKLRLALFVVQAVSEIRKQDCIHNKRIPQCTKMRICIHHQ